MKATIFGLAGLATTGLALSCPKVTNLKPQAWQGSVTAELESKAGGLGAFDGQKISPQPNITSFDWWYFDVVSTTSTNESFVIVFNEAGDNSLTVPISGDLLVSIAGTFKNGSIYMSNVRAASGATIVSTKNTISGAWKNPAWTMSFEGHRGLLDPKPTYNIKIDSPDDDIFGTFTLRSIAPPRYPCNPESVGVTEEVSPYFGWANIMPSAEASVDLMVKGERVRFSGVGYHDKNWSERSFSQLITFWYWGHAQIGPYSIVWFDLRAAGVGTQHQSGYIAKDGKIIHISCADGSSSVRPWGKNSEYPPSMFNTGPSGVYIKFDMGKKGVFEANVTNSLVPLDAVVYQRHLGKATGGIVGGKTYEGVSFFEIMHLA